MKKSILILGFIATVAITFAISSFTSKEKTNDLGKCQVKKTLSAQETQANAEFVRSVFPDLEEPQVTDPPRMQVDKYVREIFEDSKGNVWFGTLGRGIARLNADKLNDYQNHPLKYYTEGHGLAANQINGIDEDSKGNLWLSTTNGVSKFDGTAFTNYRVEQGLNDNSTWSILVDSRDRVWVGTFEGVCLLDRSQVGTFGFEPFHIPIPEGEFNYSALSPLCVFEIIEDSKGNIWFARDGLGVSMFDGKSFKHYTESDGLCSNVVRSVYEDSKGNIWFGSEETRELQANSEFHYVAAGNGGLSRLSASTENGQCGKPIETFESHTGLASSDVYPIYEDRSGNLWCGSKHYGTFRFDGKEFELFNEKTALTNNCIQSMLEDSQGNLWFGFSGGLFRFDGKEFQNVSFVVGGC
ncbi:ligand-binding sensor domain-containing protein [Halocola ammonii]